MPSVYLETTIISYLAALPSRDLIIAAHQQITHEWWLTARNRFELYVSEAVFDEIRAGDAMAAQRRLAVADDVPVLQLTDEIVRLIQAYDSRLGLTGRARADLAHLAFAVFYELDYLVTWNCHHLANGEMIRRLRDANDELHCFTPIIVTPEELMNFESDEASR